MSARHPKSPGALLVLRSLSTFEQPLFPEGPEVMVTGAPMPLAASIEDAVV
jgi:hypothetical protein